MLGWVESRQGVEGGLTCRAAQGAGAGASHGSGPPPSASGRAASDGGAPPTCPPSPAGSGRRAACQCQQPRRVRAQAHTLPQLRLLPCWYRHRSFQPTRRIRRYRSASCTTSASWRSLPPAAQAQRQQHVCKQGQVRDPEPGQGCPAGNQLAAPRRHTHSRLRLHRGPAPAAMWRWHAPSSWVNSSSSAATCGESAPSALRGGGAGRGSRWALEESAAHDAAPHRQPLPAVLHSGRSRTTKHATQHPPPSPGSTPPVEGCLVDRVPHRLERRLGVVAVPPRRPPQPGQQHVQVGGGGRRVAGGGGAVVLSAQVTGGAGGGVGESGRHAGRSGGQTAEPAASWVLHAAAHCPTQPPTGPALAGCTARRSASAPRPAPAREEGAAAVGGGERRRPATETSSMPPWPPGAASSPCPSKAGLWWRKLRHGTCGPRPARLRHFGRHPGAPLRCLESAGRL